MQEQALADVRVLDFTHYVAGPYCVKLLADHGADVIKVERPMVGDGSRRMGPFPKDEPHLEKSGLFLHLNTNKRSLALDLKAREARDIVLRLVRDVDIVVESFRPGTMARLGLDYAALKSVNPDLVLTSISNFGQTGPYRDYMLSDIMAYGMGGEMYSTGLEGREPLKLGENVVLYQAGAVASIEGIRLPSRVAQLVLKRTDHVLLVGPGALQFAKAHGFQEENLLTEKARKIWLRWKETLSDKDDWLPPPDASQEHAEVGCERLH